MRRLESGQTIEGLRELAANSYIDDQARLAGYLGTVGGTVGGSALWQKNVGAPWLRANSAMEEAQAATSRLLEESARSGGRPIHSIIPESVLTATGTDPNLTLEQLSTHPQMAKIKAHAQTIPREPIDPLRKALAEHGRLSAEVRAAGKEVNELAEKSQKLGRRVRYTALLPLALGFGSGKLLQAGAKRWLSQEKEREV